MESESWAVLEESDVSDSQKVPPVENRFPLPNGSKRSHVPCCINEGGWGFVTMVGGVR